MPIAAMFDAKGMTQEQYDQIITKLADKGYAAPDGRQYHVATPTPGGWFVLDVWESQEKLADFAQVLMPLIAEAGAIPPTPTIYPVHSVITG